MILKGLAPRRQIWQEGTLVEQLDETAEHHGDRIAFIDEGRTTTWAQMRDRSRAIARGMLAIGLARGDHVALWLPNRMDFLAIWLAAAHIGAVAIPINTRYREREFEHVLKHSDARLLFMVERFLSVDCAGILSAVAPLSRPDDFPRLERVFSLEDDTAESSVETLLALGNSVSDSDVDAAARDVRPVDTTTIIYTSGSTGVPKGVMHNHNVLRNECAITEWLDIDESSRILGHMPFFHVAGGLSALLPALITGAAVVLMDHWDPARALELIAEQKVTVFGGIATHFIDIVNYPRLTEHDISSLRTGWIGGSMNPRELMEAIQSRLRFRVFPAYGMTETTSVTTYPRWDDPLEVYLAGKGVPVSDFEVMVCDVEGGDELGPNDSGEVCVRGHPVMQGYYKMPDATAAAIDGDGWFHSGDIGRFDDAGYLSIVGRRKDMYIVGGNNVYPAEVEAVLVASNDVIHAQVVAVPDERLGEVGYAFVELVPGASLTTNSAIAFCRLRLADFKVPRHCAFVAQWPRLDNGKIDRPSLQARAIEALGLAELASRRLLRDDGSRSTRSGSSPHGDMTSGTGDM